MTALYPLDTERSFTPSPIHPDEQRRIAALRALGLLDSDPNSRFDELTNLVADVFNVPTVLISLVDTNRQWFLSKCGMEATETGRDVAFCAYAIHEEEILVVENASFDPVFRNNPLVTGEPEIRFYAGAVLRDVSGLPLGTLCLIDYSPRKFSKKDRARLVKLGGLARREILLTPDLHADDPKSKTASQRDPITNAYWGEAFFAQAQKLVRRKNERPCLVASVNFDNVQFIGDSHGRLAASELMLELTNRIEETCQKYGRVTLGRLNGKRIVAALALEGMQTVESVRSSIKQELVAELSRDVVTSRTVLMPRTSIAIASFDPNTNSFRDAVRLCRVAIDQLPKNSTARAIVVCDQVRRSAEAHLSLAKEIYDAILQNQLSVVFQPKICAAAEVVVGAECLVRWNHPQFGHISPPDIVAAARDAHRLVDLECWVIRSAFRQLDSWKAAGLSVGRVSINITGSTLANPDFQSWIIRYLEGESVNGDELDLEIVESSVFSDFDNIVAAMRLLKKLHVSFSLDDFGTDYSSLAYLRELPIDNLKIDKAFVDDIVDDQKAAALCAGILTISSHMGMTSIAEGVESENQYLILRAMRCNQIQGYYFSKPLAPDEFLKFAVKSSSAEPAFSSPQVFSETASALT